MSAQGNILSATKNNYSDDSLRAVPDSQRNESKVPESLLPLGVWDCKQATPMKGLRSFLFSSICCLFMSSKNHIFHNRSRRSFTLFRIRLLSFGLFGDVRPAWYKLWRNIIFIICCISSAVHTN